MLLLVGCGGGSGLRPDLSVQVPADRPQAPSAWPSYPSYPASACWVRRPAGFSMIRAAPSLPLRSPLPHRSAAGVAAGVLAQLGDHRYVRHVILAPVPSHARRRAKAYFAGIEPPRYARWAYISVVGHSALADWEGALVAGAVRDALCANGGPPLVAWSVKGADGGFSDYAYPFEQHFPNPTAAAFRRRVRLVARRYGFRIVELRLLHPSQLAPLLIVSTDRPRKQFIADLPAIVSALNPRNDQATTFEGFYLEARDSDGPFVRTDNVNRGEIEGGEWSANHNDYPYPHR